MDNITKKRVAISLLAICLCIFLSMRLCSRVNTDWAEEKACTEVKSKLIRIYDEVAITRSEILYKNKPDYIVVVRYTLPDSGWKGSVACHVYGYSKDNCFVEEMTNELPFDYEYNREYMKTRWAIE